MPPRKRYDENRLLNPDGFRHFRKSYSKTEARLSIAIACLLVLIGAWVYWRGLHPDPTLFANVVAGDAGAEDVVDRGPLPAKLAAAPFKETRIRKYGPKNVYEKINGREGYFKSYGFVALFTTLLKADNGTTVDVELYDLGKAENALGAYAGERGDNVKPSTYPNGMWNIDRNALLLTRGKLYLRAIGSDESSVVRTQLQHTQRVFAAADDSSAGGALPWAYRAFAKLGIESDRIEFVTSNALSFEFGKRVYTARLDDEGAQLFVSAAKDEKTAIALSKQYLGGFKSAGSPGRKGWYKDPYLPAFSTARHQGAFVLGAYRVSDIAAADKQLAALAKELSKLPPLAITEENSQADGEKKR